MARCRGDPPLPIPETFADVVQLLFQSSQLGQSCGIGGHYAIRNALLWFGSLSLAVPCEKFAPFSHVLPIGVFFLLRRPEFFFSKKLTSLRKSEKPLFFFRKAKQRENERFFRSNTGHFVSEKLKRVRKLTSQPSSPRRSSPRRPKIFINLFSILTCNNRRRYSRERAS